jgi:hypothetical protein
MTIKKAKRKLPLHDYSIVKATVPVLAIRGKLPVGSLRVLGCIGSLLKTHHIGISGAYNKVYA